MVTACVSGSTEVAEELLSYFVHIGNKECFAAMLYTYFNLLRSDVVEELSWQNGLNDFYMPYKIQVWRSLVDTVTCRVIQGTPPRRYLYPRTLFDTIYRLTFVSKKLPDL